MSDSEKLNDQNANREKGITYKRRSSVFFVAPPRVEEAADTRDKDEFEQKSSEDEDNFDIRKYINSLRKERKQWKETLQERKLNTKIAKKERNIIKTDGPPLDLSILTDSQKAFVNARPPYEQIFENIKTLKDLAVKIAVLKQEIDLLNNTLLLKIERKVAAATKALIDQSSEEYS